MDDKRIVCVDVEDADLEQHPVGRWADQIDELAALIDAASEQEVALGQLPSPGELGLSAAMVAALRDRGGPLR